MAQHASGAPHHAVTTSLILCRKLLTSDTPQDRPFKDLAEAVLAEHSCGKQSQCLDQAVACIREALKIWPSFHHLSFQLAKLLVVRFLRHQIVEDYDDAKAVLDGITPPRAPLNTCEVSSLSSALERARPIVYSRLEDNWKEAVQRCNSFLKQCTSYGNPLHPVIIELLGDHSKRVFEQFTPSQSAQTVHLEADPFFTQLGTIGDGANGSDIVLADPLMMESQDGIDDLRGLCSTARVGTKHHKTCLEGLVRWYHSKIRSTDNTTDIEEGIKYYEQLLAATHPTDNLKPLLSNFGNFLYLAFHRTKGIEYLNKSIDVHRQVLNLEGAQRSHFSIIQQLINSLFIRVRVRQHLNSSSTRHLDSSLTQNLDPRSKQDVDEVMRLCELGVRGTTGNVLSRFRLAYRWAEIAREFGRHHSAQTAYEYAISLMQSSLVFAPTLPLQHDRLVENSVLYKTPLNFASYQIQKRKFERSIETLEQGRSLLWSEMRGLRPSMDRLLAANPFLAERFIRINQELEIILTTPALSNRNVQMDERMEQLPELMERRKELLKAQNDLITEIRALPDLKDFLLPLPFDTLRSAASHGPVIIINNCEWGSDILIVLHDAPPSHVPTRYDFFDRAKCLKDELLNTQEKYGLDSDHYENALSSVLMELYELVGRPVIERLKQLGIPEQSRVWWCPTSVFGFLPLHAMGPIPSESDNGDPRYFSDVYVSSNTPTLSALIASREPNTQTSAPLALFVAQPNPSPPGSWPDDAEATHGFLEVTSLSSGDTTSGAVLDGLQRHPFACVAHPGELKTREPHEAVVRFPNGKCLTFLDIVRSRNPGGESALFLGPRTAELTEGSIPDEALHLSAAVQFSGFRSVIGTMWGTDDEAWQSMAEAVCKSMFSSKDGGEAYYKRSASALQHAIQEMRGRSFQPLRRWVKYVHHGA